MSEDTLVLAHVIFRHGDRNPDLTYPNDPHKDLTFFPTGRGQLNMKGKARAYALGQTLRKRYDNFLGRIYLPGVVDAWSSDVDRTKMSLQLVLASLFPPSEEERFVPALNWQPIPYNYTKVAEDDMLLSVVRQDTVKAYEEHVTRAEYAGVIKQHKEAFEDLSKHTGFTIKTIKDVMLLYGVLKTQEDCGLVLPSWTAGYWPKTMEDFAIEEFHVSIATPTLRKFILGKLLTKIIDDTDKKVAGKSVCKMHLYSAHDVNVGTLLSFFGVPFTCFPKFCSFLSFEVHKITDDYAIKMMHHDCLSSDPKAIVFKNGLDFLTYDEFKNICKDVYVRQ